MKTTIIAFFGLILCVGHAQKNILNIDNNYLLDDTGRERVFIHYNTSFALVGEYLYYKFYCLETKTNRFSNISKIGYIELIAENGERVFKQKVRLDKGLGQGDFFLPVSTISGNYKLVAYTQWMRNWGQDTFFKADIVIINPYNNNQKRVMNRESDIEAKQNRPYDVDLKISEKQLKLFDGKKNFSKREAVSMTLNNDFQKIPKGNYSLSVHKTEHFFPDLKNSTQSHIFEGSRSNDLIDELILPELRGELISGKVISTSPEQPVHNLKVSLSIPGEDYQLKIARTDEDGRFYFNVSKEYQSEKALLQILDVEGFEYKIEMVDMPNAIDYKKLKFQSFELMSDMNSKILEYSIQNQIENAYFKVKPDTIITSSLSEKFYGKHGETFVLDDYTRFATVRETALEILKNVWINKGKDNKYEFGLRSENGEFALSEYPSLLLVDGLVLQNQNQFISNFNATKIKSITIVRNQYRKGAQIFDGVIDVQTFDSNYPEISNNKNLMIVNLHKPAVVKSYFRQVYSQDSSVKLLRIPDQRRQLLWMPNLRIEEEENEITFYTSDVQGDFEISLEGFTEEGKPVSLKEVITVN
ncbi:hypothetical protein LV716_16285 [Flagellimonas sp. HMM57]|uniref:hypothetical protein n=1 Tax=unclassified Flagellimonas TaxID=2644544 RepID=UPI0013D4478D|nr:MULTISPECIES: hypothetical protein [unclassified Flagellimonas]UII75801.1 hypothetical protein LV716_16285 [Flagellimonas sp. HMM57]